MFIRSKLADDRKSGVVAGVALILIAGFVLTYQFWPQKKADLAQAYYSDDDGATWFADSVYKIAPFDHNGKPAYIAEIFSYDGGSKKFCAYLSKYTDDAKKKLESAISDAEARGDQPGSVSLFTDRGFINSGMMVKLPGPGNPWLLFGDPRAGAVFSIHSPDGSALDQVFVY